MTERLSITVHSHKISASKCQLHIIYLSVSPSKTCQHIQNLDHRLNASHQTEIKLIIFDKTK